MSCSLYMNAARGQIRDPNSYAWRLRSESWDDECRFCG